MGSGKSTLFRLLFQLFEYESGSIEIDGIRIDSVDLNTLRSGLSIIPQDPVLFSGTIRYNLDPFGLYDDEQLLHALDIVQLKPMVLTLPDALSTQIAEFGSNFSVGEAQLFCVARALLKTSKILLVPHNTFTFVSLLHFFLFLFFVVRLMKPQPMLTLKQTNSFKKCYLNNFRLALSLSLHIDYKPFYTVIKSLF